MQQRVTLKQLLYVIGGLAVLVGGYGFYDRLVFGERNLNYGSYVIWGLWVAMYLFFAGVAAGAYMVATLDYLFNVPLFKGTGKVALWGAAVTMPAALVSIGMDLGHMERIWKVYVFPNFSSVMAQLVWGYTLFLIITLATLALVLRPLKARERSPLLRPLMVVGLILAIFLSGGVGALLGVNTSRASWHAGLLPVQFPVFNITSGVALLLVAIAWFGPQDDPRRPRQMRVLGLALVVLLLIKTYYLWTEFSLALYGETEHSAEAIRIVLFGPYQWAFWGVQLGLGMLLPIMLLTLPSMADDSYNAGLLGVFVLIGLATARANIVIPTLSVPELQGLAEAFHGPHLNYAYFPSLVEWSVTIGIIGACLLAFLFGNDRLNLFSHTSEVTS